jgi:excisionase family DNA binding protein
VTGPLLVPAKEGFRQIGIGRDSGYTVVREGRIRVVRVGKRIYIPRRELEAFVEREASNGSASLGAAQ